MMKEEDQEEHVEHGLVRKMIFSAIAVVLLILVMSYSAAVIIDIPGLIMSKEVFGNDYQGEVFFMNGTLVEIQQEYLNNQNREIKACLYGHIEGGRYYIENVEFPQIYSASVQHITADNCADALIDLHSHPWYKCRASQQDMDNLKSNQQDNPQLKMMVMCGTNRFSIYD